MKTIEIKGPDENEIEWQSIQENSEEWSNTIEDFEDLEESREEQRRKEALFEATDYEDTEFEDVGFGNATFQKKSEEDMPIGKPFPVWILPILALLICIPLALLARHHDAETMRVDKETEALLAANTQKEQQTMEADGTADTEKTEQGQQDNKPEDKKEPSSMEATDASKETEATEASGETQNGENAGEQGTASSEVQEPGASEAPGEDAEAPYVSGDASMSFEEVNDIVTAIDATNLRKLPTTEGGGVVMAQLKSGQNIARTGINEETGWSRVSYHGQTLYAVTQFLTTEVNDAPLIDASEEEVPEPLDISTIAFVDCDDQIRSKDRVNLRTEPSTARGDHSVRTNIGRGVVLHRTGYTADGAWSRVEYNGEILYIINSYVEVVVPTPQEPTPQPEPTPEPQPEPEPEPEPQPEVTPEPQPEPTPEVTPEPQPEPTPEVTPEPQPEPTPEVTPEPQPEPTPEVTPVPQPEA